MSKTNSLSRPSLPTGWLTPPSESNNEETYGSDYRPNNYSKPLEKPFGTANRPPPLVGALSLSGRKFRFGKNRALLNTRKYPNANTSPASNKNAEWWQTAELGTGANEPSSIGWANSYNKPLATVSNGSVAPPPATFFLVTNDPPFLEITFCLTFSLSALTLPAIPSAPE